MNNVISSWRKFDSKLRYSDIRLLKNLDLFPNSILVAGCQRSGTTILSRVFSQSEGMVDYRFGRDDELDAALLLCGHLKPPATGRFCFQTTYLNDRYREYLEHDSYHLIWVMRNPHSVIYSMLHNWRTSALNRLFRACGYTMLGKQARPRYELMGVWGVSKLHRACLSYNAKVRQLAELRQVINDDQLVVVDYDDLVASPTTMLPVIYDFVNLEYKDSYAKRVHARSVNKASRQNTRESKVISKLCMPTYLNARTMLTLQLPDTINESVNCAVGN